WFGLTAYVVYIRRSLLFFFQAEDGIRVLYVTGVQTCALPISCSMPEAAASSTMYRSSSTSSKRPLPPASSRWSLSPDKASAPSRSEERRVGKESAPERWRGDAERRELKERRQRYSLHRLGC